MGVAVGERERTGVSGPAGFANAGRFNRRATHEPSRVFVVDARSSERARAQNLFRAAGLWPQCYPSAEVFLGDIPAHPEGCLVCALDLPGMDGVELVCALKRAGQVMPSVVFAREAEVCDAVRAIRAGAFEFVQCACVDDHVVHLVQRAIGEEIDGASRGKDRSTQRG